MAEKEGYTKLWKFIVLSLVTIGFYLIYWMVSRKIFLNKKGADIPTAWFIIIPIVNIWWIYKFCEGWTKACKRDHSAKWIMFILWLIIPIVPQAAMQDEINHRFYPRAG